MCICVNMYTYTHLHTPANTHIYVYFPWQPSAQVRVPAHVNARVWPNHTHTHVFPCTHHTHTHTHVHSTVPGSICPKVYHADENCSGLPQGKIPKGAWHCPWHSCWLCAMRSSQAGECLWLCGNVCMSLYVCACARARVCVCVCVSARAHTYLWLLYTQVYVNKNRHACAHTHVNTHKYAHQHSHQRIHTLTPSHTHAHAHAHTFKHTGGMLFHCSYCPEAYCFEVHVLHCLHVLLEWHVLLKCFHVDRGSSAIVANSFCANNCEIFVCERWVTYKNLNICDRWCYLIGPRKVDVIFLGPNLKSAVTYI